LVQGWRQQVCTKIWELGQIGKRVANERDESQLGGWSRLSEGGKVGRKTSEVLCTLFSKTDQTKAIQTKDLAILTYLT